MTENKRIDIILEDEGEIVELGSVEAQTQIDESIPFLKPLKKCGEVFMEAAGELVFVCTLCSEHFSNLEIFGMHLYDMHTHNEEANDSQQRRTDVSAVLPGEAVEVFQICDKDINSSGDLQLLTDNATDPSGLEESDMYADSSVADDVPYDDSSHLSSLNEAFPANLCDIQHDLPEEIQIVTYICKQCGAPFIDDRTLQNHIKTTHPLVKIFECPYCDKTFTKKISQQSHINMHTGNRPYTCKYCPKAFVLKSSLRVHTKTHFEAPAFSCTFCGKLFHQNYERKRHEAIHIRDKKYKCPECGALFLSHRYLLPHIRRHTEVVSNGKIYECDICGENYTIVDLYWHKRDHEKKSKRRTTTIALD